MQNVVSSSVNEKIQIKEAYHPISSSRNKTVQNELRDIGYGVQATNYNQQITNYAIENNKAKYVCLPGSTSATFISLCFLSPYLNIPSRLLQASIPTLSAFDSSSVFRFKAKIIEPKTRRRRILLLQCVGGTVTVTFTVTTAAQVYPDEQKQRNKKPKRTPWQPSPSVSKKCYTTVYRLVGPKSGCIGMCIVRSGIFVGVEIGFWH